MIFDRELGLPASGTSRRATRRDFIQTCDTQVLFEAAGPGCVRHWWLTYTPSPDEASRDRAHDLIIRFFYDGSDIPAVEVSLAQYFCLLLNQDSYPVRSAPIVVLPKNACNSYLPIPFESLRMEIENQSPTETCIWFMADWQAYPESIDLTPFRLQVTARHARPAETAGSYLMADFSGSGFVAGMTMGIRVKDETDAWFHTGGDLWLLDGETAPNPMRGIGGEDVFGMSFGVWNEQAPWIGTPHIGQTSGAGHLGYECVNYRFFGPDPVWFDTSAVVRFGSKGNDTESVVYAYLDSKPLPSIQSPESWQLAGPFQCRSESEFRRTEWGAQPVDTWPDTWSPDFGQYVTERGAMPIPIPVQADTEHGWCDLSRHFRGRQKTNHGTQPTQVSAYAAGTVSMSESRRYRILVGFDDWMQLTVNGEEVFEGRHETGFSETVIACDLPEGDSQFVVKLSNDDNFQWRLWAFSFRIEE